MSESRKNLYKALANFQQTCPIIHKATEGYGYSYASLDHIIRIINPVMAKNGLGFTQLIEGRGVRTILFHWESGEEIESYIDIPQGVSLKGMNQYQVDGSSFTYYKRYALGSILGVITDKDLDASGEQVQTNGIDYAGIDPHAQGKELEDQLTKAIMSMSRELEPNAPVQYENLANEGEMGLRSIFDEYRANLNDLRAQKWCDDQLEKPRKSGTIEALRKLVQEARDRGFYTPYVELKLKEKAEEVKNV